MSIFTGFFLLSLVPTLWQALVPFRRDLCGFVERDATLLFVLDIKEGRFRSVSEEAQKSICRVVFRKNET